MPLQYAADTPPLVRPGLITALQRAGLSRSYQDQASIQRLPATSSRRSQTGGVRPASLDYAEVATTSCRLTRGFILAREQLAGGGITNIGSAILYTAPGVDIRPADRLIVSSLVDSSLPEVTLEVLSAEVRRTTDLEQVVTCQLQGVLTPLTAARLST